MTIRKSKGSVVVPAIEGHIGWQYKGEVTLLLPERIRLGDRDFLEEENLDYKGLIDVVNHQFDSIDQLAPSTWIHCYPGLSGLYGDALADLLPQRVFQLVLNYADVLTKENKFVIEISDEEYEHIRTQLVNAAAVESAE